MKYSKVTIPEKNFEVCAGDKIWYKTFTGARQVEYLTKSRGCLYFHYKYAKQKMRFRVPISMLNEIEVYKGERI